MPGAAQSVTGSGAGAGSPPGRVRRRRRRLLVRLPDGPIHDPLRRDPAQAGLRWLELGQCQLQTLAFLRASTVFVEPEPRRAKSRVVAIVFFRGGAFGFASAGPV